MCLLNYVEKLPNVEIILKDLIETVSNLNTENCELILVIILLYYDNNNNIKKIPYNGKKIISKIGLTFKIEEIPPQLLQLINNFIYSKRSN